ncbi:MAG: carbon-nitrogen hydrolase family protein [Acidobacteria bacterium]|nr:carbon-nitrogen hydrolase family protein [Acidobacteriota bacterium]
MRVTVCELDDDPSIFACQWEKLVAHVGARGSQLVLLPEMPFHPWLARRREFDLTEWKAALMSHDAWFPRLQEMAPAAVLGTRPVVRREQRLNEGFVWDIGGGYRPAHFKHYLPEEEGFWEATWFGRGDGTFVPAQVGPVEVGFAICTELWFFQHARAYGKQGIHIIASPRGTMKATVERWLVGGRATAITSGAFSLSSNRVSSNDSEPIFGGRGWIVSPDGEVLGLTSREQPFVTVDIDLNQAEKAKEGYPQYVLE